LESERLNEASIKNRRQKLAEFLRQAETLKNLCGSSHVLDEHLIEVWWNDVTTFLATEFGEDQLQVFKSDSGAPSNILVGPDIPQRNRDSWAWLNRRTFRLLVMLEPNTEAHRRSPLF
jgi:hypothetical protein